MARISFDEAARRSAAKARLWHAALAASLALTACAPEGLTPAERSELDNMWRFNQAPKSSPAQLVAAFDRFCVRTPRAKAEATLRDAGYTPLPERVDGTRAFVVDDSRPAVAISDTMCVVRAKARSGQTERFTDYVARAFPGAVSVDPSVFEQDIEAAWQVGDQALIGSQRRRDVDFFDYTLIYFTPGVL